MSVEWFNTQEMAISTIYFKMTADDHYRLICGDAAKVIPRLVEEGVKVNMVFCSPNPLFYFLKEKNAMGIGTERTLHEYLEQLVVTFTNVYQILKDTGSLWVHMMDTYMMHGSMTQVPERFALMMTTVSQKERLLWGGGGRWFLRGKRCWLRGPHELTPGSQAAASLCSWDWEPVYWFTKQPEGYTFNADSPYAKTSVIKGAPYTSGVLPAEVMRQCIDLTTKEGDTVLDCFMGTGETGLVALQMGRKFIGIDISAEKVALAQRRLRGQCVL